MADERLRVLGPLTDRITSVTVLAVLGLSACAGSTRSPGTPATRLRGGMIVPSGITAPAATIDPLPIRAPFRMTAPIPTSTSSSRTQPCTVALWPIVTRSPTWTW